MARPHPERCHLFENHGILLEPVAVWQIRESADTRFDLEQKKTAEGEPRRSPFLCPAVGTRCNGQIHAILYATVLSFMICGAQHSVTLIRHSTISGSATEVQDEAIAQERGMMPLLERVLAQRGILKA